RNQRESGTCSRRVTGVSSGSVPSETSWVTMRKGGPASAGTGAIATAGGGFTATAGGGFTAPAFAGVTAPAGRRQTRRPPRAVRLWGPSRTRLADRPPHAEAAHVPPRSTRVFSPGP